MKQTLINFINYGEKTAKIKYQCFFHQKKEVTKMKIGKLEKHLKVTCHYSIFIF